MDRALGLMQRERQFGGLRPGPADPVLMIAPRFLGPGSRQLIPQQGRGGQAQSFLQEFQGLDGLARQGALRSNSLKRLTSRSTRAGSMT